MHQRLAGEETGIVDEKLRGEIIDAVDHDIVVAENLERIAGREPFFVHRHTLTSGFSAWIFSLPDRTLGRPTSGRVVKNLTLQIGQIHDIAVDRARWCRLRRPPDTARPASRGLRRRREESSLGDLLLSLAADFRQEGYAGCSG